MSNEAVCRTAPATPGLLNTTLWLAHIRSGKWKPLFEETFFPLAYYIQGVFYEIAPFVCTAPICTVQTSCRYKVWTTEDTFWRDLIIFVRPITWKNIAKWTPCSHVRKGQHHSVLEQCQIVGPARSRVTAGGCLVSRPLGTMPRYPSAASRARTSASSSTQSELFWNPKIQAV